MHAFLLFVFLSLALVCHHLLDEGCGISDAQGKECSSNNDIYMPLRHGHKPLIEVLEHELVLHSVVWASLDVILEPFPRLRDGFE